MTPKKENNQQIPAWDLSDLYTGLDDPHIEADINNTYERAKAFEKAYRNKINTDSLTSPFLQKVMKELEIISEQSAKLSTYAYLLYASDTSNPAYGAFHEKIKEKNTDIRKHILFFELEWVQVSDADAEALLQEEALSRYKHSLENERIFKPHKLSEPEEKIMDEKNNVGPLAFQRLFDEIINNIVFRMEVDGEKKELSESELLKFLYDESRDIRKAAARSLTEGLVANGKTITFIFNTLLKNSAVEDSIRSYPSVMAAQNLSNEIDQSTVDAFLNAVEAGYDISHDYYRLKKKVLKVKELYDYDRYAPIVLEEEVSFPEAQDMALQAYGAFSPRVSSIVEKFFAHKWIDAKMQPGKRGGAFSHGAVPSVHPYILMNYAGTLRDVSTLVHELGHGVHQYLSRKQGMFHSNTPLTTAETASVFGEILLFDYLKKRESDPRKRLALIMGKCEEMYATVFRQVIFTRFEEAIHTERREKGELEQKRYDEIWMEQNKKMFGDTLTLTDDYAHWWLYIPHFVHVPFYCYAYAFGQLLVLALYQKYLEDGKSFVPGYIDLLSAGGSDAPHVLLHKHVGVDITDPAFWQKGMNILRDMLAEAVDIEASLDKNK